MTPQAEPIQAVPIHRSGATVLADADGLGFASCLGNGAGWRARRLVACWNACLHLTTEQLEAAIAAGQVLVCAKPIGAPAMAAADQVGHSSPRLLEEVYGEQPPNGEELSVWDQRWTITEDCHDRACRQA
jgi:hypothetical protein